MGEEATVTFKITHVPCSEISHYKYINKSGMIRFNDIQTSKPTWFGIFRPSAGTYSTKENSCLSTFSKTVVKTICMMFTTCFYITQSNHSRVTGMYYIYMVSIVAYFLRYFLYQKGEVTENVENSQPFGRLLKRGAFGVKDTSFNTWTFFSV